MPWKDLREFLRFLEEKSDLVRVRTETDVRYEIGRAIRKTSDESGPALLFERVKGFDIPVLGGLYAAHRRILWAFEKTDDDIHKHLVFAMRNHLPPCIVKDGSCQEIILEGKEANLRKLPICIHSPRDNPNPYVTAAVQIAEDPMYGRNLSIARCMVVNERKLIINCHPPQHLAAFHTRAEERGQPLEIAMAIGVDPIVAVASQFKTPLGVDETTLAGAARGQPVNLVKCVTADVHVPAEAEVVIEGRLLPEVRMKEGPFAEYTGYVGYETSSPVMEVTAITMRADAIYQTVLTGRPMTENHHLKQIPLEAMLFDRLNATCPDVKAVHLTPGGGCQDHAVIAIKQTYPGEAKTVIYAAFAAGMFLKHVVVVDEDVNVRNMTEVERAVAYRFQATKDLVLLPEVVGGHLDPSAGKDRVGVLSAGMGLDATKPFGTPFPEPAD